MNDPLPGSRMARELRARRCVRTDGAEDPDGVVAGSSRTTIRGAALAEHGSQDMFRCESCLAEYRTKRGLGVHVARAHPLVANSAVDTERVKARWSAEEVRLMARAEAAATLAGGIVFMNQHLQEKFPHRSLEAVKGKRRQGAYREMVRGFCQEMQSQPAVVIDEGDRADTAMIGAGPPAAIETTNNTEVKRDQSAHRPPPELSSQRLRDFIERLIGQSLQFRSFEADTLAGTARAALPEGVVDMQAIERWLCAIFPPPAVRPPQRVSETKQRSPNKRESRKQKRKREYALVQSLYKKNHKTCLSYILGSGSVRERPSPVDFCGYWRPIMETSSDADGDMAALRESHGVSRQVACTGRSLPSRARGIHLEGLGEGAAADPVPAVDRTSLWDPITPLEVRRISVKTGTAPGLDQITPRMWNAVPCVLRALLFNLLLLARTIPSSIATTRTVFLEKAGMSERPGPEEYRPLSIGSVVIRHFHKIFARRLAALDIIDTRQRRFQPVDGV